MNRHSSSTGNSPAIPLANIPQNRPLGTPSGPTPPTHPASQLHQSQVAAPSARRAHRHDSIFHFRSERAQWLGLAGIVLAIVALASAWVYAANAQKLAEWEAEKDYQLYCQGFRASSQPAPSDCNAILNLVLPPPPGHSPGFFTRMWVKAAVLRRAGAGILSARLEVIHDTAEPPLWLHALILLIKTTIILGVLAWMIIETATPRFRPELPRLLSFSGSFGLCMYVGLRVLLFVLAQFFSTFLGLRLGHQAKMIALLFWTLGHLGAIYGSRKFLDGRSYSVLHFWALLGVVTGILTDRYATLWKFILCIFSVISTISFTSSRWVELEHRHFYEIEEPDLGWSVWNLGRYGSQIGGVLFLCDSLPGFSVLGLRGFWVAEDEYPEPMLPLVIIPVVVAWQCCFVAFAFDVFGHVGRHRRISTVPVIKLWLWLVFGLSALVMLFLWPWA